MNETDLGTNTYENGPKQTEHGDRDEGILEDKQRQREIKPTHELKYMIQN